MALTRKLLKTLGIEDDKADEIIAAHVETVDALKSKVDESKAAADELAGAKKELEELRAKAGTEAESAKKYADEHAAFEAYKAEVEGRERDREKSALYRKVLEGAGIDPKRMDSILKVTDLSGIEVEGGAIKGADELGKKAAEEWADFVLKTKTSGAPFDEPPAGGDGAPKTLAEALHRKYNR